MSTQRKIQLAAVAAFFLSMIFPPFHITLRSSEVGCGYGFIFAWPELSGGRCKVDAALLLLEWIFIVAANFISIYAIKTKEAESIAIQLPYKWQLNWFFRALVIAAISFVLGSISENYSAAQMTYSLTDARLVAVNIAIRGSVYFAFGYGIASIWSRARGRLSGKSLSITSKLVFAFCLSLPLAFSVQGGKPDTTQATNSSGSHFVFEDEQKK